MCILLMVSTAVTQQRSLERAHMVNEPEKRESNTENDEAYVFPPSFMSQTQTQPEVPQKYLDCLNREFEHTAFHNVQWAIIRSIMHEARDNCAIMATGYGKSLTYQFPAVYFNKVAIVVSPLISLMQDQVNALNIKRERACLLGRAQPDKKIDARILALDFNIVYATPERITSEMGLSLLRALGDNLVMIAVDEAHCISYWGHDFRPAYRNLQALRQTVPHIPILALTATATTQVRDDICQQLRLRQPQLLSTGYDRPNLEFIVRPRYSLKTCGTTFLWNDIGGYITWALQQNGSVIVYCNTCKYAEMIANALQQYVSCHPYHSTIKREQKKQFHQDFSNGVVRVIVATMAFGMGIDKQNVRLVVHYGAPSAVERYYQEVGRAGRDGLPAKCILFHNDEDWKIHQHLRETLSMQVRQLMHAESLQLKMTEYISTRTCRRKFILEYFEDEAAEALQVRSACCDNCLEAASSFNYTRYYDGLDKDGKLNITNDANLVLSFLRELKGCLGIQEVIHLLRGSQCGDIAPKYFQCAGFGKGAAKSEEWYKLVIKNLQALDFVYIITKRNRRGSCCAVDLTKKATNWLRCPVKNRTAIKIEPYKAMLKFLRPKEKLRGFKTETDAQNSGITAVVKEEPDANTSEIIAALHRLRSRLACDLDIMPFVIASNKALYQIASKKPKTLSEFLCLDIDGFNLEKSKRFGEHIIKVVQECFRTQQQHQRQPQSGDNFKLEPLINIKQEKTEEDEKALHEIDANDAGNEIQWSQQSTLSGDFANMFTISNYDSFDLKNEAPSTSSAAQYFAPNHTRRNSENLWDSDSSFDDEAFTQIGDSIEREIAANKKKVQSDDDETDCELDLLLADIEQLKKEEKAIAAYKSNVLFFKKNSIAIEYIETDSSDVDETKFISPACNDNADIAQVVENTPKTRSSTPIPVSTLQRKRHNSENLWGSDSSCNDEDLTQISDSIEKQIKADEKNSKATSNMELDLLLVDVEHFDSEAEIRKQIVPQKDISDDDAQKEDSLVDSGSKTASHTVVSKSTTPNKVCIIEM